MSGDRAGEEGTEPRGSLSWLAKGDEMTGVARAVWLSESPPFVRFPG